MRPKTPRVGDKCGRQVKTHAAQGTQSGRQVWKTSVGDKWKTSVKSCGPRHPSVRDKWETSVKSSGPRHPEWEGQVWETSVGDKWKTSVNSPLVSHTCLPHLSPTLVSHTCLPLWVLWAELTLVSICLPHLSPTLVPPTLGALGRMILHLSPTCPSHLGALGRMILHLSSICLPHLSSTLVSHSGCLGLHEFSLVSHTCLPLWVSWAA